MKEKLLSVAFVVIAVFFGIAYQKQNKHVSSASIQPADSTITAFVEWFESNGGKIHPLLKLTQTPSYGYALVVVVPDKENFLATQSQERRRLLIPEGTQLLEIPAQLHLTIPKAKEILHNRDITKDSTFFSGLSDFALLTLALMVEHCRSLETTPSFFRPYLDILLRSNDGSNERNTATTLPVLTSFSDQELGMLHDPDLRNIAQEEKLRRQAEWEHVVGTGFLKQADVSTKPGCFQQSLYEQMYAAVTSHCVMDQSNGQISLVPMADMVNHAPRKDNPKPFESYHQYQQQHGSLAVLADRNFVDESDGDTVVPIMEEYSKLDNSLYLLNFGFCPEDNPYHCVMLQIKDHEDEVCVGQHGELVLEDPGRQIDRNHIREAAKRALESKPTKLKEDMNQLRNMDKALLEGTVSQQMHLALVSRIEDMKLLHHLANLPGLTSKINN